MAEPKPKKRKQGRPVAAETGVGREGVLAAAIHLLQTLPPAQVSINAVAREAGVDPALIRYYFKNREALLFLAVREMIEVEEREPGTEPPVPALEEHFRRTFRFTRSAKYMQRLMIEELDCASTPEVLEQVREWNRVPVEVYDAIREQDGGRELTDFDPLFLHLAVIGISDFFVTGAPLIRLLVPPETDMAELGSKYEAFVTRLLLHGLRRRKSDD
jgi:AcrR family transcriptional regulator